MRKTHSPQNGAAERVLSHGISEGLMRRVRQLIQSGQRDFDDEEKDRTNGIRKARKNELVKLEAVNVNNQVMKKSIVLLGKTGAGKSTTANVLYFNRSDQDVEKFAMRAYSSFDSCTKAVQSEVLTNGRCEFSIIDTPGLMDTGEGDAELQREVSLKLADRNDVVAFVLCVQWSDMNSSEFRDLLEYYMRTYRDAMICNRFFVLHTHISSDMIEEWQGSGSVTSIEAELNKKDISLRKVAETVIAKFPEEKLVWKVSFSSFIGKISRASISKALQEYDEAIESIVGIAEKAKKEGKMDGLPSLIKTKLTTGSLSLLVRDQLLWRCRGLDPIDTRCIKVTLPPREAKKRNLALKALMKSSRTQNKAITAIRAKAGSALTQDTEIVSSINMEEEELEKTLQSLLATEGIQCSKVVKYHVGPQVFHSKNRKLKIEGVHVKSTDQFNVVKQTHNCIAYQIGFKDSKVTMKVDPNFIAWRNTQHRDEPSSSPLILSCMFEGWAEWQGKDDLTLQDTIEELQKKRDKIKARIKELIAKRVELRRKMEEGNKDLGENLKLRDLWERATNLLLSPPLIAGVIYKDYCKFLDKAASSEGVSEEDIKGMEEKMGKQ